MNTKRQRNKPEEGSRPNNAKKGISRRGFLRGAGLTTVGTMALQTGVLGSSAPGATLNEQAIGPDATLIKLQVNGKTKTLAKIGRAHV